MQLAKLRNLPHNPVLLWIALIFSSMSMLVSCGDNHESAEKSAPLPDMQSFTFFDLGKTSLLTKGVRSDLRGKLGRDAIERRSILDLEINYRGFLKRYFPDLAVLNEKLNYPPGERVEHKTVKLMYRYARKKNVPFDLVELVFSDYTKTPLFFKINFKADEANTVETLREKYGAPEVITWGEENGKSMFWQKSGDVLIISLIPNQFGSRDHQIVIYFMANLKQLIDMERKEKELRERQRSKTGKEAF